MAVIVIIAIVVLVQHQTFEVLLLNSQSCKICFCMILALYRVEIAFHNIVILERELLSMVFQEFHKFV